VHSLRIAGSSARPTSRSAGSTSGSPGSAASGRRARAAGNNVVKIILIVVAIFVGLGILGAGAFTFMVWRVATPFMFQATRMAEV